jgi:dTDP-4-dehydrorhamnose 3,5-epimerase-like enzyme
MNDIDNCKIIDIQKVSSDRGSLSVLESSISGLFDIKRIYFTYDIPSGSERGGHAHKELYQLIVAASGSFDVVIDDGEKERTVFLNNPSQGLLITPGIWRELKNFCTGSVVLVMASEVYKESDYIRDYKEFKAYQW